MRKFSGFSLLESMLSLAIMGVIISCLFSIFITLSKVNNQKINEQKFHYIRIAIQNYLLRNGCLPRAASKLDGIASNEHAGFVPYKTLGISASYALDTNKKPFKYVVNELFTNTNIPLHTPLSYKPQVNEQSFLRLYKYDENGTLNYDFNETKLKIFDNNIEVITPQDYFFVMPELTGTFKDAFQITAWIKKNDEKPKNRKIKNMIAWLLISFGANSDTLENQENRNSSIKFHLANILQKVYDQIYYQTRFDMAAQIGISCTSEPIYLTPPNM